MIITNKYNLPKALVHTAMASQKETLGDISVTQLSQPPQKVVLERANKEIIEQDVSDMVWALFGTSLHRILERADDEPLVTSEMQYSAYVNQWKVTGTPDQVVQYYKHNLDLKPKAKIRDFKVTSVWSYMLPDTREEWVEQLNSYSWLVEETNPNIEVDALEDIVFYRDWRQSEKLRYGDKYPEHQVMCLPVTLWHREDQWNFVESRVKLHQDAQEAYDKGDPLPECSNEDRWMRDEAWAVKRAGRQKAIRVFDNPEEAHELAEQTQGNYVEHRPGTNTRCERYCMAAPFCKQWEKLNDQSE